MALPTAEEYFKRKAQPQPDWIIALENKYLADAKEQYPEGVNCGVCGKENDNADDIGWWYAYYRGKYVAHCDKCAWAKGLFPHHGER